MERSNGSGAGTANRPSPADLLTEASTLVLGDWAVLSDDDAAVRLQKLEQVSRLIDAGKINGAADVGARASAGRFDNMGAANPANLLRDLLNISPREAAKRLALAEATHPVFDGLTFTVTPARQPLLADALNRGDISIESATLLMRHVAQAEHLEHGFRIEEGTSAKLEASLVAVAANYPPDYVDKCANRALNHLDPDGNKPTEGELLAKEGISFSKPRRGLVSIHGHITVPDYEELITAIGTATNPHTTSPRPQDTTSLQESGPHPASDGAVPAEAAPCSGPAAPLPGQETLFGTPEPAPETGTPGSAEPLTQQGFTADNDLCFAEVDDNGDPNLDRRTYAQKLLHGLIDVAKMAVRTGKLPETGGLRPQLMVTVPLADLKAGLGSANVPMTGPIPITEIRKLACDAEIIPIVLGTESEVLDVGRSLRIIPDGLRKALIARDLGCTFPGCDRPSPWTEAHHILPWSEGGHTSLDNSCLLCSWHHHLVHRNDWTLELRHNHVYYTPPIKADYQQRPRRNHYHQPPDLLQ